MFKSLIELWFEADPLPKDAVRAAGSDPVKDALMRGVCPDCGSKEFYEGPSGGICTNWKCAGCGSKFNIGGFCGQMITAERI